MLTASASVGSTQEIALPKGAKPIPATRPEMKAALDALKNSTPRLPLPASDSDKGVNNGRMRARYIPAELRVGGVGGFGGDFGKGAKEGDDVDRTFNTKLFWIVCRVNNCRKYWLGAPGKQARIARAWPEEDDRGPRFRLVGVRRQGTARVRPGPQADVSAAFDRPRATSSRSKRLDYSDAQILNMICSIAGFNAMNRWTDGLAIPQEKSRDFGSPVAPKFADRRSQVALLADAKGCLPASLRRSSPSPDEFDTAIAACRKSSTWVELASAEDARKWMPEEPADRAVPNWVRLLAATRSGQRRIKGEYELRSKGSLDAKLRAQIDWIAAYHDDAWYALAHAELSVLRPRRIEGRRSGRSTAGPWTGFPARERGDLSGSFAYSTVTPMSVTDDDFVGLRKDLSDAQVAEVVHRICEAAYFDRVTEAAQLPLE